MRKKILILSYSDLSRDPRVKRQIKALTSDYKIFTAGLKPIDNDLPFIKLQLQDPKIAQGFHLNYPVPLRKLFSALIILFEKIKKLNRASYYENIYWHEQRMSDLKKLRSEKYDLVLANDIDALPLALKLKTEQTKVILDSHEYHPLEFEENPDWIRTTKAFVEYLCATYLNRTDRMFTICKSIAEEYKNRFSINPLLLTNATEFKDLHPVPLTANKIRIVHHGIANKARKIELMIEMMKYLDDRFELTLILAGAETEYTLQLKKLSSEIGRVTFLPSVPTDEISNFINQFDVGLFLLPPTNFNYKYALPNKFFEFIQARLAIAIGPSPEMKYYTERHGLGIVAPDFDPKTLAALLNKLTNKQVMEFKNNCHINAEQLSARVSYEVLRSETAMLLAN